MSAGLQTASINGPPDKRLTARERGSRLALRATAFADLWAMYNANPKRTTARLTPVPPAALFRQSYSRTLCFEDRHAVAVVVIYPSAPGVGLFVHYVRPDFFTHHLKDGAATMRRFLARAHAEWPIINCVMQSKASADEVQLLKALRFKRLPDGLQAQASEGLTVYARSKKNAVPS